MAARFSFKHSICFNEETGQLYAVAFRFREGKAARTVQVHDNFLIDLDKDGRMLGVELLGPCRIEIVEEVLEKKRAPVRIRRFVRETMPVEFATAGA